MTSDEQQIRRADRTRDGDPQNIPRPLECEADRMVVETTWGEVQPLQVAAGVATVGELEVIELLNRGAALVDTRVPDSRSGVSLPGAVNIPFQGLLDDAGGVKAPEEIRSAFARTGALDDGKTPITYCGGGIAATLEAFQLARLGRDDVAVYDGSLTEWAADHSLPLETGESRD